MKFTAIAQGPTFSYGPPCRYHGDPAGVEISSRFYAMGVYAAAETGGVWVLVVDHEKPGGTPPYFTRLRTDNE